MKCVKCENEINPKRLQILPNTKVCTNCSSTSKLVGVPITIGTGDHTYNDINIMTSEIYEKYYKLQISRGKVDKEKTNEIE